MIINILVKVVESMAFQVIQWQRIFLPMQETQETLV